MLPPDKSRGTRVALEWPQTRVIGEMKLEVFLPKKIHRAEAALMRPHIVVSLYVPFKARTRGEMKQAQATAVRPCLSTQVPVRRRLLADSRRATSTPQVRAGGLSREMRGTDG